MLADAAKKPQKLLLESLLKANMDDDDKSSSKKKKDAQSYWEAIVSNRDKANSLLSDGTIGQNLFEKMATLNINYRINEERHHRCPRCWYCSTRCVCDSMPDRIDKDELSTTNVKILLLMHHKEYLNAGNSAKSLIALLPTLSHAICVW